MVVRESGGSTMTTRGLYGTDRRARPVPDARELGRAACQRIVDMLAALERAPIGAAALVYRGRRSGGYLASYLDRQGNARVVGPCPTEAEAVAELESMLLQFPPSRLSRIQAPISTDRAGTPNAGGACTPSLEI